MQDYGNDSRIFSFVDEYYEKGLKEYYDSNLLSIMLAPMYPENSRNILWVLKPNAKNTKVHCDSYSSFVNNFEACSDLDFSWDNIATPWSSSDKWKELNHYDVSVS